MIMFRNRDTKLTVSPVSFSLLCCIYSVCWRLKIRHWLPEGFDDLKQMLLMNSVTAGEVYPLVSIFSEHTTEDSYKDGDSDGT